MKYLRLQQGDQFAIPFSIFIGDQVATPDNVDGVRVQINTALCEYPGTLTYNSVDMVWEYPLTETQTRSWAVEELPCQVGVKIGASDFRYCPTFPVLLEKNIITQTWGT